MRVSPSSAGTKLLLLTLLAAAGGVAGATAATVYAAGDVQRAAANRGDTVAAVSVESSRQWDRVRVLADSLLAPLGAAQPLDSTTLRQVVALVASEADSAMWIPHDRADTTLEVALPAFRRWVHAEPLPSFWGMRPDFAGLRDSRAVPMTRMLTLKRVWKANEAEADSALVRDDTTTALLRARENLAGARQLLWQPRPIDAMVGRMMLTDGAKLLARTALQSDEPSLHSAAIRLQNMTNALQVVPASIWRSPGGEANEARLREIARDRSMLPAARFAAIERMVALSCLSTRDVLFGPSKQRQAAVDAMISDASDIPRLSELRSAFHRTLIALDESPEAMFADMKAPKADKSFVESLLRVVVPRKVQARIDACRSSGA